MKQFFIVVLFSFLPLSVLAQSKDVSPNCAFSQIKESSGKSAEESARNLYKIIFEGEWRNIDNGGGWIQTPRATFPLPQYPPEPIYIKAGLDGMYAYSADGKTAIKLTDGSNANNDGWDLSPDLPIGTGKYSAFTPDQIKTEAGCDLADLPTLEGYGKWSSAKGDLEVHLFLIPTAKDVMKVVMEGLGHSPQGAFFIRRFYTMSLIRLEPLTAN